MARQGIYCGNVYRPGPSDGPAYYYQSDRHGLVIGPTGCGKTAGFLLNNLLNDGLNGQSLILIDPKAELAAVAAYTRARRGDKVKILDPFGILADLIEKHPELSPLTKLGIGPSIGFNPMQALDPDSVNFYDDAAAIGEALIKIDSSKESHWPESAQGLLVGLLMWVKLRPLFYPDLYKEAPNLSEVRKLLTEADAFEDVDKKPILKAGLRFTVRTIIAHHDNAQDDDANAVFKRHRHNLEIITSLVARFEQDSKEMTSIRSTADTQTRWLLSPPVAADLRKRGIDFRELKKERQCVFVILPSSRLRTHSVWLRLVIVTALKSLYTPRGIRTTMFIDEMPALGHLPPLVDAFALVRGYNIGLVGIAQDLNQLKALYQDHWESFVANAGFIIGFGPNDLTTADWMSRRAGETTVPIMSVSENRPVDALNDQGTTGSNESYIARRAAFPQELFGMEPGTALLFRAGIQNGALMRLRIYEQVDPAASRVLFNPYN